MDKKVCPKITAMKFKVFLLNYLLSIICIAFVIVAFPARDNSFDIFMSIFLLIVAVANPLLSHRQYVYGFRLCDDHLEIKYITILLQSRTFVVALSAIESIELKSKHSLLIYPPALDIKQPGDWQRFYIIEKNMLNNIGHQLATMTSVRIQTS